MEKSKKRALRRHHRSRMIKRAFRMYQVWNWNNNTEWAENSAKHNHSHMAVCSCNMCCNTRSNPWLNGWDKLTFQERKSLLNYQEQLEDLSAESQNKNRSSDDFTDKPAGE